MNRFREQDNSCGIIICAVIGFIALVLAGSLLVYYNYLTVCDNCQAGYNSTINNNGVKSCANDINGVVSSYTQCHIYYREPGFGFGCFFLAICWLIIGAPVIIVVPD